MRAIIRLATLATRSGSGPPASGGSIAAATSPSADMTRILGPAGGVEHRAVPKAVWVGGDVIGDLGAASRPRSRRPLPPPRPGRAAPRAALSPSQPSMNGCRTIAM